MQAEGKIEGQRRRSLIRGEQLESRKSDVGHVELNSKYYSHYFLPCARVRFTPDCMRAPCAVQQLRTKVARRFSDTLLLPSTMSVVLVCGPVEYIHPELTSLAESGVEIIVGSLGRFPAKITTQLLPGSTSTRLLAPTSSLDSHKAANTLRSSPSIETTTLQTKSGFLTPRWSISFRPRCDSSVISAPDTIKSTSRRVLLEVRRKLRSSSRFSSSFSAGIAVSSTPGVVDASTATAGMFLVISALRSFWKMQQTAQRGDFKQGCEVGNDPEGKVLGIIGLGGIGKALAKRALGFDMKIQYHNRKPLPASALAEFPPGSITYVDSMDTLLSTSDVVSLSIPLNEKTKGSFGTAQFAAMKQSACFINTARGAIVDEAAMLHALKSGKVSHAQRSDNHS